MWLTCCGFGTRMWPFDPFRFLLLSIEQSEAVTFQHQTLRPQMVRETAGTGTRKMILRSEYLLQETLLPWALPKTTPSICFSVLLKINIFPVVIEELQHYVTTKHWNHDSSVHTGKHCGFPWLHFVVRHGFLQPSTESL